MNVFNAYAHYYDLLYKDKDYESEAEYVSGLLRRYAPDAESILELGCGTGGHAVSLAEKGYKIHGTDLSEEMLVRANERLVTIPRTIKERLTFSRSDIRTLHLKRRYDAIIALFHVMSYQTTDDDLRRTISGVKSHLKKGGIFIFDCWYGPAVLAERPSVRIKRAEDERVKLVRIAEPRLCPNDNRVDVQYQVFVEHKGNNLIEEFGERHEMRYFFLPELVLSFSKENMKILDCREWMTGRPAGCNTWSLCLVVKDETGSKARGKGKI